MHGETSGGGLRACGGVALVALLLATSGLSRAADAIPPSPANEEARCDGYPAAGSAANPGRDPRGGGFVDYLDLFYCVLGGAALGYAAMAAWLAVLFYLLADTAAVYFCSSLEGLARLLGLPPAIAGATLLSLENSALDALSTLTSFVAGGGVGAAAIGLNSMLGEEMLVSTTAIGVVALRILGHGVAVDRASFFHDGWLTIPLYLPRRLTIPTASKERLSKTTVVTTDTLAPIFMSILWSHCDTMNSFPSVLLTTDTAGRHR